MKATLSPRARLDAFEITEYLNEQEAEGLGDRFFDSMISSALRLAEDPYMGRRAEVKGAPDDLRVWRVKNFESWLFFYRPTKSGVHIFRILHGARDLPRELEFTPWED